MRLLIQITTYENIPPPQERSRCQWGWKLFFTGLFLFGRMKYTMKNTRQPLGQVIVWEQSQDFCAATFLLELLEGEDADYWKSGSGHKFTCASLLKRPICTYAFSEKKGFSFAPIINAVSFSFTKAKKQCRYLITLMHRKNIQCLSKPFQSPAASR